VVQDLSLETPQYGAGIDPELLDEPCAGLLEGLQRICLPSRAIEREHQLSAHSLTQRVIDDEAFELGDELRVPAELEVSIDLLLNHRESELFEPHSLGGGECLVAKVRQRLAAEDCERLSKLPRPCGWTIRSRRGDDSLQAVNVQLIVSRKPQSISRRSRLDPLSSEPLPQGRDMTVQSLLRCRRRPRAPQALDQLVACHHVTCPKQQEREQRTLLRPHRREIHAIGVHLEPTQKPKPHPRRV
jgi:hypothetical protein